jgi:hypothetical protein
MTRAGCAAALVVMVASASPTGMSAMARRDRMGMKNQPSRTVFSARLVNASGASYGLPGASYKNGLDHCASQGFARAEIVKGELLTN